MTEEARWDLRRAPRHPDVLSRGGLEDPTGSGQAFQLMVTRDAWLGRGGLCLSMGGSWDPSVLGNSSQEAWSQLRPLERPMVS